MGIPCGSDFQRDTGTSQAKPLRAQPDMTKTVLGLVAIQKEMNQKWQSQLELQSDFPVRKC